MQTEPYDASDKEAVQERKIAQGREDKSRREALEKIMGDPNLRVWIKHLLEMCHVGSTSIHENPYITYSLEGERNIGLRIMAEIEVVAPRQFAEMMLSQK